MNRQISDMKRQATFVALILGLSACSALDPLPPSSSEEPLLVVLKETRLTRHDADVYSVSWAHTGDRLVYSRQSSLETRPPAARPIIDPIIDPKFINLWISNSDGTQAQRLTAGRFNDYDAALDPSEREIVFFSDRSTNLDVWKMSRDGSEPRQLTTDPASDVHPSWSPDGSRVAFISNRSGEWAIWLMTAEGENQEQMTWGGNGDWSTTWSPDGGHIAFASTRITEENLEQLPLSLKGEEPYENFDPECVRPKLYSHIWTVDVKTKAVKQLTRGKVHDWRPSWSPDGKYIAFVSDREGSCALWVMDHTGNNLHRLTRGTPFLYDGFPAWHPRRQELAFISNREGTFDIWLLKVKAAR